MDVWVGFNHAIIREWQEEISGKERKNREATPAFYKHKSIKCSIVPLYLHILHGTWMYYLVCGLVYWTFVHLIEITHSLVVIEIFSFLFVALLLLFDCEWILLLLWTQRFIKMAISLGLLEIKVNNISGWFGSYRTKSDTQNNWRLWRSDGDVVLMLILYDVLLRFCLCFVCYKVIVCA